MAIDHHLTKNKPALMLLVLLLVTLWVSVAHQHHVDDPHPQFHCAVCVQLHSAHLAVGKNPQIQFLTLAHSQPEVATSFRLSSFVHRSYQSRAPPHHIFIAS